MKLFVLAFLLILVSCDSFDVASLEQALNDVPDISSSPDLDTANSDPNDEEPEEMCYCP